MTATTYRIHGITDDTDTCEICGKIELRRVVMLMALDADGNDEEIIYAGTTCAARKLAKRGKRTTAARVRDAASAAATVWANAREWADEFSTCTLNTYIAANSTAYLNAHHGDVTAALAAAKAGYAAAQNEAATIHGGNLTGTRFARLLPTI